ncbi:hypothetical protein [Endozoicomonas arenosclerae]|uniref:hypothetical protein n=1 Tax=Endozoicomonas arenosclerae TaxID=1633495 RepID=UPI00129465F7|nr:hypothetical protein [Endozoicomonas arenosclerae]
MTNNEVLFDSHADYSVYRCSTNGDSSLSTLKVLTITSAGTKKLTDTLCSSPTIAAQYSNVETSWQPRGLLSSKDLLAEQFDLLWSREYRLLGLLPDLYDYYTLLVHTPKYDVYWMSLKDKPERTQTYFSNKTLGLLDDSQSRSGFMLPLNDLRKASIIVSDEQKRFYPSRSALYKALSTGEVDVISGISGLEDKGISPENRLLIASNASTGSWFIKSSLLNSNIHCELMLSVKGMISDFHPLKTSSDEFSQCG